MRIATIFGSSSTATVTDPPGGACARVDAAPVRSASAKIPRHPLAQPDFMFPFAQTKGSTAALPAQSALALPCNLAGAAAVPAGTVPFVNAALQEKYSRQMLFADLSPRNVEALLGEVDVLLDGTDNFETRFLINDVAVKSGRPWIYAAGVASYGLTMTIRPGATPCLACLLESGTAAQGLEETCDTMGVLGPIGNLIASLEVAEALKLLS